MVELGLLCVDVVMVVVMTLLGIWTWVYLRVMMGDQLYEELMDGLSKYARRRWVSK